MTQKVLASVIGILLAYSVLETVSSTLYHKGILSPTVLWIFEERDPNGQLQMDTTIGAGISSISSRVMTYHPTKGVQLIVPFKGNNYGLADKKNFIPKKESSEVFRVIVFGESYTSPLYVDRSWVELTEAALRDSGPQKVEIYNFSIDASGLASWANMMSKIVIEDDFEVDAIVLAACCDALARTFLWWKSPENGGAQTDSHSVLGRYADDFNITSLTPPKSNDLWEFSVFRAFQTDSFEKIISGELRPSVIRRNQLYIWSKFMNLIEQGSADHELNDQEVIGDPERLRLLDIFSDFSEQRNVPIYVVSHNPEGPLTKHDVDYINASESVFFGLDYNCDQQYRIEDELHWNQRGHEFVAQQLTPYFMKWLNNWINR